MSISLYTPPPMPADEARRERAVTDSGLLQTDQTAVLQQIAMRAAAQFGTSMAAVTVIHQQRQILLAAIGMTATETSRSASFCGHAIATPDQVMCVPDAQQDDRFAGNPLVQDEPQIRFYAGAPLLAPSGEALGTLCVFDRQPHDRLSAADAADLQALADQVMAVAGGPSGAGADAPPA